MPDGQPTSWSVPAPTASSPLERLYDAVGAQLYRYFYQQVGNREEAEDLTSEVFLKASRLLDTSRDEASQRAWLRQAAQTGLADYWRRFYLGPTTPLVDEIVQAAGWPTLRSEADDARADKPNPDPAWHARAGLLPELLARLPENYRRV